MIKKTVNCLIDFFSEEIPADMQKVLESQIETIFKNQLNEKRLKYENMETFSSPRHLAVKVNNLQKKTR